MKDYFGYKDKVCVVTGAASGMAKAATEMLVDLGAKVYALDVNETDVPGISAAIKVNLGDKASIDEAFKQIPEKIDCFFGIAGISGLKSDFLTTYTVNFIANKYITLTYLTERMERGGAICFISSNGGAKWEMPGAKEEYMSCVDAEGWEGTVEEASKIAAEGFGGNIGYGFSKRSLNYFIMKVQEIFCSKGIRVNGVLPATTKSGLVDDFVTMTGGMDNAIKYTGWAGRLAESYEMGQPCVFLNSNMASYISGVLLSVDFGDLGCITAGLRQSFYPEKTLIKRG